MKMESLQDLLADQIKDLFSAEKQLIKALPKMAKKASSPTLRAAIESHLEETEGQAERLEEVGTLLGIKVTGKRCAAMEGLIEEGKEILEADGDDAILDAALIGAAQRVEHYEIAAYGTARAIAEALGKQEVVELLQATLDEEGEADQKLSEISEGEVLPECQRTTGESEDDEMNAEGRGASSSTMSRSRGQSDKRAHRGA